MFDLMPFDHRELKRFNNYFNDLERSFFGEFPSANSLMHTDILDEGDHYLLEAELPGFAKEEIKIDVDGERMTITAEHAESSEENGKNFVRRERRIGSFARSFDITGIKAEGITAAFNNGVLELTLPKAGAEDLPAHRIEIK